MSWLVKTASAATNLPILDRINKAIVDPLILLLAAASLAMFLYGVYEMVMGAANEEERKKGQQHVLYGVIGLFIIFSVKGILSLIYITVTR